MPAGRPGSLRGVVQGPRGEAVQRGLPDGGEPGRCRGLLQEIFLSAHRKLDGFRGESALGTWLYRLATNHCLDYLRSRAARTNQLTEGWTTMRAGRARARGRRTGSVSGEMDLERALAQLPEGCRAAFVLHDVQGLEHREVARGARHRGRHVEVAGAQGAVTVASVVAARVGVAELKARGHAYELSRIHSRS